MIEHKRRSLIPTWTYNPDEPDSPPYVSGVVTPADIARCTDFQITGIKEDSTGTCTAGGTSCVSTGQYSVTYANAVEPVTFKWQIVSGAGATIPSDGQGGFYDHEKQVIVNVSSASDVTFVLEVTATDAAGHVHKDTETYTHVRT